MGRKSKGGEISATIDERAEGAQSANTVPEIAGTGEELEEVRLLKPHTHEDVDYAVGAMLTVRPPIADWLRARGVIAPHSNDPA